MTRTAEVTVKAVVAYAAKLRRDAERKRTIDPHYKGYEPTDGAARKNASRFGPAEALRRMATHAVLLERTYEQQQANSAEARKRLQRAHAAELERRRRSREERAGLDRILEVVGQFRVRPNALSADPSGDRVSGTATAGMPPNVGDPLAPIERFLLDCARKCEGALDRADGLTAAQPPKRESDEYARLDAWTNFTPEDIAAAHQNDEHLGRPSWVRDARRSMSLDPETGKHIRRTFTPDDETQEQAA